MRKQANDMKKTLAEEKVTGEAYHGKVRITMNGNQEIEDIDIDVEVLSAENKDTLEQEIKNAFQNATKEIQKVMARKIQSGELSLPF